MRESNKAKTIGVTALGLSALSALVWPGSKSEDGPPPARIESSQTSSESHSVTSPESDFEELLRLPVRIEDPQETSGATEDNHKELSPEQAAAIKKLDEAKALLAESQTLEAERAFTEAFELAEDAFGVDTKELLQFYEPWVECLRELDCPETEATLLERELHLRGILSESTPTEEARLQYEIRTHRYLESLHRLGHFDRALDFVEEFGSPKAEIALPEWLTSYRQILSDPFMAESHLVGELAAASREKGVLSSEAIAATLLYASAAEELGYAKEKAQTNVNNLEQQNALQALNNVAAFFEYNQHAGVSLSRVQQIYSGIARLQIDAGNDAAAANALIRVAETLSERSLPQHYESSGEIESMLRSLPLEPSFLRQQVREKITQCCAQALSGCGGNESTPLVRALDRFLQAINSHW